MDNESYKRELVLLYQQAKDVGDISMAYTLLEIMRKTDYAVYRDLRVT